MFQWISALALFLISLLLEVTAQGATLKTVHNGDFCQVREVRTGHWRIDSLADGRKFEISEARLKNEIEPRLAKALKEEGIDAVPADYDLHLHCTDGGTAIVFNFAKSDPRLCVVASSDFETVYVQANNEAAAGAPCEGERPQALIAAIRDPNLSRDTQDVIRRAHGDIVESVEDDGSGFLLLLKLKEIFRFKEGDAKSRLEADANLMGRLQFVDYDRIQGFLGETVPLIVHAPEGAEPLPESKGI